MPVWDKTTDHIITLMVSFLSYHMPQLASLSISVLMIQSPGRVEEGDNLVLTIIPVHDDNIDFDYETVSDTPVI